MTTAPSRHERFKLLGLPAEDRLAQFAHDVGKGLTASPKHLPCCYFYDRLGSLLFEAICEVSEYYLTRAETTILETHAEEIAALLPDATDLIELGSGSAAKTRLLIEAFLRRHPKQRYVPLDICRTVLEESSLDLLGTFPTLHILAIAAEYREGLKHLQTLSAGPGAVGGQAPFSASASYLQAPKKVTDSFTPPTKLILWLGSNIGNLERAAAAGFLAQIRQFLAPGDRLLIGIDLRKDRAVLEAAYNDACGVTAAFNRNLLLRINRELGGQFDLRAFQHRALYDEELGRIEMHLVSDTPQKVPIERLGITVSLQAGEAIHTENCYKYSQKEIEALAATAGLCCEKVWLDPERRFAVTLFKGMRDEG
jgi:L-histidine N-alpha-methyltransferase